MVSLFTTLFVLVALAIPIFIVVKIAARVREVSSRLGDPARFQRVFAQSAAAALRRAGANPQAVAKLEVLGMGTAVDRAAERKAAAYEARIGLQRKGGYAEQAQVTARPVALSPPPSDAEPLVPLASPRAVGHALHRPSRPRVHHSPVAPLGGFDMSDRFRLSEPPDISEPHGPMAFNANWLALVAALGAGAWFFLR